MLYLLQIAKMLNDNQLELFISLFNDLSYEIDGLGYKGNESELVNELLDNHFGIYLEDDNQLNKLTSCILNHQNNLDKLIRSVIFK